MHPFLISPLAIILILYLDTGSLWAAIGWAGLCAAFVVGPALIYLRRRLKRRQFTDADVSVREHRFGFYLFGAACMVACFVTLLLLDAPPILITSFTAALCALGVAIIVNRLWLKVSIHAGVMAGVTTATAFYSIPAAMFLVVGTLIVIWARLVLRRHTALEALVGLTIATVTVAVILP